MKYLVPEYYDQFKCKCGECRHSCCDGWPIRISMKEYYHLLGIRCSDSLRRKLDCALNLCHEPGKEGYAQLSANWLGLCMLQRDDGLCALQMELGDSLLPQVCKLYPRSSKQLTTINQGACSNSCEGVIELLMQFIDPLKFEERDLLITPEFKLNLTAKEQETCKESILIMQNRNYSLPDRFLLLGNHLNAKDFYSEIPSNRNQAFLILNVLNQYFINSSISEYCLLTQEYFNLEGKKLLHEAEISIIYSKYQLAKKHLEVILPDWQTLFEQLVVNHMFYNSFPYIDNHNRIVDSYLSLTLMYSFLRFNLLVFMANKTDSKDLVDFLSAIFRIIEHSNFKSIIAGLFKSNDFHILNCVPQLVYI